MIAKAENRIFFVKTNAQIRDGDKKVPFTDWLDSFVRTIPGLDKPNDFSIVDLSKSPSTDLVEMMHKATELRQGNISNKDAERAINPPSTPSHFVVIDDDLAGQAKAFQSDGDRTDHIELVAQSKVDYSPVKSVSHIRLDRHGHSKTHIPDLNISNNVHSTLGMTLAPIYERAPLLSLAKTEDFDKFSTRFKLALLDLFGKKAHLTREHLTKDDIAKLNKVAENVGAFSNYSKALYSFTGGVKRSLDDGRTSLPVMSVAEVARSHPRMDVTKVFNLIKQALRPEVQKCSDLAPDPAKPLNEKEEDKLKEYILKLSHTWKAFPIVMHAAYNAYSKTMGVNRDQFEKDFIAAIKAGDFESIRNDSHILTLVHEANEKTMNDSDFFNNVLGPLLTSSDKKDWAKLARMFKKERVLDRAWTSHVRENRSEYLSREQFTERYQDQIVDQQKNWIVSPVVSDAAYNLFGKTMSTKDATAWLKRNSLFLKENDIKVFSFNADLEKNLAQVLTDVEIDGKPLVAEYERTDAQAFKEISQQAFEDLKAVKTIPVDQLDDYIEDLAIKLGIGSYLEEIRAKIKNADAYKLEEQDYDLAAKLDTDIAAMSNEEKYELLTHVARLMRFNQAKVEATNLRAKLKKISEFKKILSPMYQVERIKTFELLPDDGEVSIEDIKEAYSKFSDNDLDDEQAREFAKAFALDIQED